MLWLHLTLCVFILGFNLILPTDTKAATLKSKVVDAETNEPIEGAIVVVVWMRPVFVPCMDSCSAFHEAAETVTDAQGNFSIDISMGLLANERKISIYKPGYYRPGYYAAPWLTSREDPPPGESQVVRLIKARSLLDHSSTGYEPNICYQPAPNRWCVPPSKVKNYVRLWEMVRKIQESEIGDLNEPSSLPSFHEAVSRSDVESVRSLLSRGANPNEPDKDGRTPLMLVTNEILIDRIRRRSMLLPSRGPPVLQEIRAKQYHEGSARHVEILRTLLAAGANPNLKAKNGDTALTFAIPTRREIGLAIQSRIPGLTSSDLQSPELVQELLTGRADPNLRINHGLTPLMIAAGRGLAEIVKTLLAHGADVNLKADFGLTAYHVTMGDDVIEAIKKARGPTKRLPPPPGITARTTNNLLREAAWNGNANVVRALIVEEGADPNFQDKPSEETPIYFAIRSGHLGTVETMLKHGANPNISVPNSGSPLTFATKWLKPELATGIIKALVDAGAVNNPAR